MKLFQLQFAFLSLLGVSSACLVLSGQENNYSGIFQASLVDNDIHVCNWNGKIDADHYFATCKEGFAAFIHSDLSHVVYNNNGYQVDFDVNVWHAPEAYFRYTFVSAKNYGC